MARERDMRGKSCLRGIQSGMGKFFGIGQVEEEEGDFQLGVRVEEGENGVRKDARITTRALCISNRAS